MTSTRSSRPAHDTDGRGHSGLSRLTHAWLPFLAALLLLLGGCTKSDLQNRLGRLSVNAAGNSPAGDPDGGGPDAGTGGSSSHAGADGGVVAGPQLIGSQPAAGAMDVPIDMPLELRFDRPVVAGGGNIVLKDGLSDDVVETVEVTASLIEDDTVTVVWGSLFKHAAPYYVVVEPDALEDKDRVRFGGLSGPDQLAFTTEPAVAPRLTESDPSNGDLDVPIDTDATFTFDQDVIAGPSGEVTVFLADSDTSVLSLSINSPRAVFKGKTLTVALSDVLELGQIYYILIDSTAVLGDQGAYFPGLLESDELRFTTEGATPLVLLDTHPARGALSADPDVHLSLTFDQPVVLGSGSIRVRRASDGSLVEAVDVASPAVAVLGSTVTVELGPSLEPGGTFYVTADSGALRSMAGGVLSGLSDPADFSFTTGPMVLTPVTLVSRGPADGASGVSVTSSLVLVFSGPVVAGSGKISVVDAAGAVALSVDASSAAIQVDGDTVTVALPEPLKGNASYAVLIAPGFVESTEGASFAGISSREAWRFETEDVFSLVGVEPLQDGTDVEPGVNLVITFSAPVAIGSGVIEIVSAVDGAIESIPVADGRVQVSGNAVTIDPDNVLAPGENVSVLIESGAIIAADGSVAFSGFTASDGWTFETASPSPGGVADGLMLWVDADYAPGLKRSGSGVRLWADRSGRYNNLRQGTAASRPVVSVATINDRAVVRFDGTDDRLVAASGLALTSFEGLVVWQSPTAPSTTAQRYILVNGQNFEVTHGHTAGLERALNTCIGATCTGNWFTAPFTPAPVANSPALWNFGFSAGNTSLFASVNGGAAVNETGPNGPPAPATTPFSVGGAASCAAGCPFGGDVAEVVLFARTLTDDERMAVTEYLRAKWATPEATCGAGETRGPNGSCYFVSTANQGWAASRAACQSRGAGWDLVAVQSQAENDYVVTLLSGDAWIGATDQATPDSWRWVTDTSEFWTGTGDGSPVGGAYNNWRSGQPSGGDTEGCARYTQGDAWGWADAGCDDGHQALCEGPGR